MRRYRSPVLTIGTEAELHQQVADYLRLRYPHILWRTDFAAGIKMSVGMAARHKRLQGGRAWPDIFIAHKNHNELYSGLFLELKRQGTRVFKKDGALVADAHIQEQAAMLQKLRERGYKAEFAIGFDQARSMIDQYLESETSKFEGF